MFSLKYEFMFRNPISWSVTGFLLDNRFSKDSYKREVIWVNGVIPSFYRTNEGFLLGLRNRAAHVFGFLDIRKSEKDLNKRIGIWMAGQKNKRILDEYNQSNQTVEIFGRSAYRTRSLEENIIATSHGTYRFSFPVPKRFNTNLFKTEVKEEAVRSFCTTVVGCCLDQIFGQVDGILHVIQKVVKILTNGLVKGYIKGRIVLEVIIEFIVEGVLIVFQGLIPPFLRSSVKGGLISGLKKLIYSINEKGLAAIYPEDVGLETMKGVIRGSFKDACVWVCVTSNMHLVVRMFIGSIIGPIIAAGIVNIFITQALG